jgi:hypothetical protein
MSTHTERATRMYGGNAASTPKPPTAASASAQRMYGNNGGLDRPISSYYDRREASLRADREGMETARAERKQVEAFARSRGITPEHLHEALAVMGEYDRFPKGPETIVTRRAATVEALRLEKGGHAQAQEHLRRYVSVTTALAKEVPSLAARANATGAGEDLRIVNALAHYGEAPTSTTEK